MTREVENFKTIEPNKAKLYTCGLTVYSQPHIGNWVGYVYWDILVRMLQASGYEVDRTQNYTDVGHLVSDDDNGEDKMEKGARAEGITAWDVAEKYIKIAEDEGYAQLGLIRPNLYRATDYIEQQIAFVKALQEKGYTYEIPDEGIYFDTSKLKEYGKLARLDIEGLEAGARVAIDGKKNITDFALWKFSPKQQQRDMEWESPWGKGFPGWHLECSVIARETLGDQIDLHAGGVDHIPVHHTNEIAQTEALTGKPFSAFWVHNNHLKVDGGKMSKSLGNIYTLTDIIEHGYSLAAFKLMILSKHYRTEGNFTWDILEAAQNRLNGYREMAALQWQAIDKPAHDATAYSKPVDAILEALQQDMNTPEALVHLGDASDYFKEQLVPTKDLDQFKEMLLKLDELLGLNLSDEPDITDKQKALITERLTARTKKNWQRSDEIRDELAKDAIAVRDTPHGPIWYRTK